MYEFTGRVRYSETDMDAKLSLTGIMNYLQDCSIFQSEDIGVGIKYLSEAGKAWLLSSWQIEILRRPELGEEIRVATWPYEFKGIYGLRNFAMYDSRGEFLVKANSCWFLTNTETGKPIRVTEEDVSPYGMGEERLSMEYAPRKITLPAEMETVGKIHVMKHQIDTNHHVNNAQYMDMARELLPVGTEIGAIRAEYKKAAVLGDIICLKRARTEGAYVISLCDETGAVFSTFHARIPQPLQVVG